MSLEINRSEAYSQGLRRFFTGRPCKKGHIAERYVSSGGCVMCAVFKPLHPSPFRKGWISYDSRRLWVPLGTTEAQDVQLHNYLQACIDSFYKQLGVIP